MPINFLPNDPLAANDIPLRQQQPKPNRPSDRASVKMPVSPKEAVYPVGTAEFLYWQAREAVHTTLEMWESIDGPITKWARSPNRKQLILAVDAGEDLNAYYDGKALKFFHSITNEKTTFSGASTDVVSHECGHALLDVIRPQLWDANFTEVAAFHEAFGDCMAILTALYDKGTRMKLLAISPALTNSSFVETLAEDLSDGVRRRLGSQHPASSPRRAINKFKWTLPSTLNSNGPPHMLTNEVHSFGRVFLGCFYDLICASFAKQSASEERNVWAAAKMVGKLLLAGARNAPLVPRFFQSIGRTMVLADQEQNGGTNKMIIDTAFANHGITLGSSAMVAARAALKGTAPKQKRRVMTLSAETTADLARRFALSGGRRANVNSLILGAKPVAEMVFKRSVELGKINKTLTGVVAFAHDTVLVGEKNNRAAIVGSVPDPTTTEDEVLSFAESLVKTHSLLSGVSTRKKFSAPLRRGVRLTGVVASPTPESNQRLPTHKVSRRGKRKVLERVRFACECHSATV
jgi:hypothetical protein